jgi:hypothetical protein
MVANGVNGRQWGQWSMASQRQLATGGGRDGLNRDEEVVNCQL